LTDFASRDTLAVFMLVARMPCQPKPLKRCARSVLLAVLFLGLLVELSRFGHFAVSSTAPRRGPRPLRPRTPDDCEHCRDAATAPARGAARSVVPYAQRKSRRGRKKTVDPRGQACPNPTCDYHEISDPAIHALVGYGHPGQHDPIQDFFCPAGRRKFSARRYTPRDRLRAPAARVAQVLHAMAEGLSAQATARVFQMSETTVRSWITRAGQPSRSLHARCLHALKLTANARSTRCTAPAAVRCG